MAYVVIQHLDPEHVSKMPEVLRRSSALPVTEARNGMKLQPNNVLVLPSNCVMTVTDGSAPPSAELRFDQKDSDSLPPYEVLDPILEAFIEEDLSVDQITARGYDRATVGRILDMVKRNEYKRRQAPPGVRVSGRAFGRDWRYPITSGYKSH